MSDDKECNFDYCFFYRRYHELLFQLEELQKSVDQLEERIQNSEDSRTDSEEPAQRPITAFQYLWERIFMPEHLQTKNVRVRKDKPLDWITS